MTEFEEILSTMEKFQVKYLVEGESQIRRRHNKLY